MVQVTLPALFYKSFAAEEGSENRLKLLRLVTREMMKWRFSFPPTNQFRPDNSQYSS